MVIDLHGWSQHARTAIYNFVVFQPFETMLIALCFLMLVVFALNFRKKGRRKKKVTKPVVTRGTTMTKAQRAAAVKRRVEDIVCDGLEKAILRGELTPQEASVYYKRYANAWKAWGLLPKKIAKHEPSQSVKELIHMRAVKFRNYLYKPVTIPGDKPPMDIKPNVYPERVIARIKGVFAGKRRMA